MKTRASSLGALMLLFLLLLDTTAGGRICMEPCDEERTPDGLEYVLITRAVCDVFELLIWLIFRRLESRSWSLSWPYSGYGRFDLGLMYVLFD